MYANLYDMAERQSGQYVIALIAFTYHLYGSALLICSILT